jgi:hypothetical protein
MAALLADTRVCLRRSKDTRGRRTQGLKRMGNQSLDDLVGAREQRLGHGEAQRSRGLQVEREGEFCGLHHGQVARLWLEQGAFRWPPITNGVMRLSPAQLAALVEGLDWSRVHVPRIGRPQATR